MKKILYVIVSFTLLVGVWQVAAASGIYEASLFPSPLMVLTGLRELIGDGILLNDIADSMVRFAIGFLGAIISGCALGMILGVQKRIWNFINPIVQFLRPISPIAWLPFIVLWFGIGDIPAIVIIFIAGFFPVLLSTVTAVGRVDSVYLKVADNFGLTSTQKLFKIILPNALPGIMTGIHLALGTSWVFLVAGEMVGAQSGLGYLIIDSRNNLRLDWLMGAMVVIGLIGVILDFLVGLIENKVIRKA